MPPLNQLLTDYADPGFLLYSAATYFVAVVLDLVRGHWSPTKKPLSISALRDEAFARFWVVFSAERDDPTPQPPSGSATLIPPLLRQAYGTVLDLGPGSGTQLPLFAAAADKIDVIYGAEPCVGLHPELLRRVAKTEGLKGGKYVVLGCGAEEESLLPVLADKGVLKSEVGGGVFDTVVCVRVLCSVPDQAKTLRGLYRLLKPGGKLIVVEHVRNDWRGPGGSLVARLLQLLYTALGWSFFLGDCELGRDTRGALLAAAKGDGGWGRVELETKFGWSPLPYLAGVCVKKG